LNPLERLVTIVKLQRFGLQLRYAAILQRISSSPLDFTTAESGCVVADLLHRQADRIIDHQAHLRLLVVWMVVRVTSTKRSICYSAAHTAPHVYIGLAGLAASLTTPLDNWTGPWSAMSTLSWPLSAANRPDYISYLLSRISYNTSIPSLK